MSVLKIGIMSSCKSLGHIIIIIISNIIIIIIIVFSYYFSTKGYVCLTIFAPRCCVMGKKWSKTIADGQVVQHAGALSQHSPCKGRVVAECGTHCL